MKELGTLGKLYQDGETIGQQNDPSGAFYVVQEGNVAIVCLVDSREIRLATCGQGDIIGDWTLDTSRRYAPLVRAEGQARVLTIHRKLVMQRIHEDPSLAFRILEIMSRRIQSITEQLIRR